MRRRLVVVNVAGLRNERVSAEYNAFMTHRLRHLMRVTAISSRTSNISDDFLTSIKSIVGVAKIQHTKSGHHIYFLNCNRNF